MSRILTGTTNATGQIQPTSLSDESGLVANISTTYSSVTGSTNSTTQSTRGVVYTDDTPALQYTGMESDSASVFVDNYSKTIKADVKIQSLLGHTPSTAFPGNEGYRNTQEIEKLQSSIAACLDTVNNLARDNQAYTSTMSNAMSQLESLVEQYKKLCTSIHEETKSSVSVVNQANTNLSKKVIAIESQIASNQSTTDTRISAESRDRALLGDELRSSITEEVNRATSAESALSSQISTLTGTSNRTVAEVETLKSKALSLNTMIESIRNSEELTETLPDLQVKALQLQQELQSTKQVTTQQLNKIQTLLDNVGIVAHNALINSSEHDSAIVDLQKTEGALKTAVSNIESDTKNFIKEFQTTAKILTTLVETLESTVEHEKLSRQTQDELQDTELAELNTRVSTLQTDLTTLIHNVRTELQQMDKHLEYTVKNIRYDFIDGGNAPI